jgi:hypothetical protein
MELDSKSSVDAKLYGNYRAEVIDNKDPLKCGRVKIWIPDIMVGLDRKNGLWARPANNPVGGRNLEGDSEHHYMGTCYIPRKGAWVWIFFEAGNINRPYYFGALDLENTKVLPENQIGDNYEDKWTIFKSHEGRTIIISDDAIDARVEITGKKAQLGNPPTGNKSSVFEIDGNQNVILLDERAGKEKILIRTKNGDFLHIDIDERMLQASFENDIRIQTGGDFFLTVKGNINILSEAGNSFLQTKSGSINVKVAGDYVEQVDGSKSCKSQGDNFTTSQGNIHHLASGSINDDGCELNEQSGQAVASVDGTDAVAANPSGGRET